ncbi:hypothetical protein PVAP13_5KG031901 [Panicum virgatum]|uniref:SGNH hydrolase-type esterase domain-containing protein n=1 Tax=Panicum virgatum TaxID=38727 RepID=A0A8T0S9I4_PANVG|nr:hypothetical protein PVAP13_5KG031901 [Panicum virgatum]
MLVGANDSPAGQDASQIKLLVTASPKIPSHPDHTLPTRARALGSRSSPASDPPCARGWCFSATPSPSSPSGPADGGPLSPTTSPARRTWCCAASAGTTRGGCSRCCRGPWRARRTRRPSPSSSAPTTPRCPTRCRRTRTCRSTSTIPTSAPSAATSRFDGPPLRSYSSLRAPVYEPARIRDIYGVDDPSRQAERTNEAAGSYAQACMSVAKELGYPVIDIWTKMQEFPDWQTSALSDGLHFSPAGNKILFDEVVKTLASIGFSKESLPSIVLKAVRRTPSKVGRLDA